MLRAAFSSRVLAATPRLAARSHLAAVAAARRPVHTEAHMKALGIELPAYQDAVWSYVKAQRDGDKYYIGGNLDRVDQVIKVVGIVNGTPDFRGHGSVVN